jgi:hypothetical protein
MDRPQSPPIMGTAKRPSGFLITGNFTETGGPAYRGPDATWTTNARAAALFATEDDAKAVVESARKTEQRVVSDPYVLKIELAEGGEFVFTSAREQIRAGGPTTPVRRPDRS